MPRMKNLSLLLMLNCLFLVSNEGLCADDHNMIIAHDTLSRWVDPVIIEGEVLDELIGSPLSNLRVYAFQDGAFEPIRYQFDERTGEGGDWVLPEGPIINSELGNQQLDKWDFLVVMAKDTGDRVNRETWPSGYSKGCEIEVIDPLTGGKGWCYLLCFPFNPPPRASLPDYVSYDYDTEWYKTDTYHLKNMIDKKGRHRLDYVHLSATQEAGGNGRNLVDRIKIRITLKALAGRVTLRFNEERLKSDVLAYTRGPIRVIRRSEQFVSMPGYKAARAVTDHTFYRTFLAVPAEVDIPFRLDSVLSSCIVRFGSDFSSEVFGATTLNSCNPQGFLVDGKMDDGEETFNPGRDQWRLIYGKPVGGESVGFMARTIFTPDMLNSGLVITEGLIDDVTQDDPPENDPGLIGYLYQDWDITKLKRGKYQGVIEFHGIPHYKPGDEIACINYEDQPLLVRTPGHETVNQSVVQTKLGKKYK